MSAKKHTTQHTHDDHAHGHDVDANHGTLRGYLIGFFLSVNLTAIPFWLVMGRPFEGVFSTNIPVALMLMVFAVVQMVVHMVYFLHMHPKSENGWTMLALFFTVIVVVIVMSGSMWVMYHLNTNMMPSHDMGQVDTTGEAYIPSAQGVAAGVSGTEASPTAPLPDGAL